ncbi:MAG: methyltransferase [Pseudomonadota bacterium]
MGSLEQFKHDYDVKTTKFSVAGQDLTLFTPVSIDRFINTDDVFHNFPLWTKIWEATAVLSTRLSTIPVDPGVRLLEIGAGMGVTGIYAAKLGHRITITEYNTDALAFARANAALNNIPNPDIRELDWNLPMIEGQFDYIIGSEIVFKEQDIMGLFLLFKRYLKPDGTIILAETMRKTSFKFIQEMEKHYTLSMKKHAIKTDTRDIPVVLFEMKEK